MLGDSDQDTIKYPKSRAGCKMQRRGCVPRGIAGRYCRWHSQLRHRQYRL